MTEFCVGLYSMPLGLCKPLINCLVETNQLNTRLIRLLVFVKYNFLIKVGGPNKAHTFEKKNAYKIQFHKD